MKGELVRGTADIPLSALGRSVAREKGIQYARKGGIDSIVSSSLDRAVETAHAIHRCCPKAQFREITGLLATRGLGGLEAMAKTPEIDRQIKALITTFPNRMPPEPTKEQLRLGIPRRETTNHFASRVFGWMAPALQKYLAQPDKKYVWVIHHFVIALIEAWGDKGFQPDFSYSKEALAHQKGHDDPGQVEHLYATNIHKTVGGLWGDFHIHQENMRSLTKLDPGIYLQRHSLSIFNPQGGSAS